MLAAIILTTALSAVPNSTANVNTPSLRDGASATVSTMAVNAKPLFSADGYTPEDKMQP